uniref:UDP-glucose glycoprotein glucosyltransferase 1 n=1 Tax=Hucho hucho TaxID=62062 RepID=A0A4W5MJ54_9TELE
TTPPRALNIPQLSHCALLLSLSLLPVVSGEADSKAVTTSLTTKWASTPLLLEASEFLAEESQEMFWDFVEANQNIKGEHDDQAYYDLIVKRASTLLSTVQLNMLKFALSLRAYSATVHSFQQIASNEPPPSGCSAFFNVHGEKSCDTEKLAALMETAAERPTPYLLKSDHRFPGSNPDTPVVILYAEIGSSEFTMFHQLMLSKANKGLATYVLRHYLASPSSLRVYLSGYGVELAIKNQEYKAKDDTQVQGAEVNATLMGEKDPVDEVQGFLFGKLKTLYPELKEQLKELRKHLVESTNEMAPLKVWQMQDLSFQTAARILAAPSSDALNVMRDLSQNFPTKARYTHTWTQTCFFISLVVCDSDSALFINGL